MQRIVVLYDTDDRRRASMRTMLELDWCDQAWEIREALDVPCLRKTLQCGDPVALVADAQSYLDGPYGMVCGGGQPVSPGRIQTVLTGVAASTLVRASNLDAACLLPDTFDGETLRNAVERAFARIDRWLESPLVVHTRQCDRKIQPSKVTYVESDRRKVRIHVGGDVIVAYGKISELCRDMPSRFVQCHKSFLVNMGFIEELGKDSVTLTTGDQVPVSQKRRKSTREAFLSYVGRSL